MWPPVREKVDPVTATFPPATKFGFIHTNKDIHTHIQPDFLGISSNTRTADLVFGINLTVSETALFPLPL